MLKYMKHTLDHRQNLLSLDLLQKQLVKCLVTGSDDNFNDT